MANTSYTYSVAEVADILGTTTAEIHKMIHKNEFPFQVIKAGERYYIPAKPLDEFINGKKTKGIKRTGAYPNLRSKLVSSGQYVHCNHPVKRELSDAFDIICMEANRKMEVPLYKWEWLNVAIQEFIDRRKAYLDPQHHSDHTPDTQ